MPTGLHARREASAGAPPPERLARVRGCAEPPWPCRAARAAGESSDSMTRWPAQQHAQQQLVQQREHGLCGRKAGRHGSRSGRMSEEMAVSRGWQAAYGWQTAYMRARAHPRAHRPLTATSSVATVDILGRNSATAPSCGDNARLVRIIGRICGSRGAKCVSMSACEHIQRHAHESAAKSE